MHLCAYSQPLRDHFGMLCPQTGQGSVRPNWVGLCAAILGRPLCDHFVFLRNIVYNYVTYIRAFLRLFSASSLAV